MFAIIVTIITIHMSRKYKIRDSGIPHFITSTVVNWIDIFTRLEYRQLVIESLSFCVTNKGLKVHSFCIMSNHIHLVISSSGKPLPDIIRDFKSFTSSQIHKDLLSNSVESRRRWMLYLMCIEGEKRKANKGFQFWQQHNQPIELYNDYLIQQKIHYIHMNPVKAGYVFKPEEYIYSSAVNYAGFNGVMEVDCIF